MSNVEIFENERATQYDSFIGDWVSGYQYFMGNLPKILCDISATNLLVVGCGTGNEIATLVQAPNQWQITGIDPSPDMIVQAKTKLFDYPNVSLVDGVVADLDVEHKFDVATLLLVLHFLKDDGSKLQVLQDISNRLVSGATFVMLDMTGTAEEITNNFQVLKKLLPVEIDAEEADWRLQKMADEFCPISESRLAELFEQSGFEKPQRFFQSSVFMGFLTKKK